MGIRSQGFETLVLIVYAYGYYLQLNLKGSCLLLTFQKYRENFSASEFAWKVVKER